MQAIRYAVVLLTAFIAGSRAVDAARSWNEWQSWAVRDPSAAEAYRTFFLMSAATAVVSLAIAALVWWLLRPKNLVGRR
jgi:ABC-type sulfate transport system permease component